MTKSFISALYVGKPVTVGEADAKNALDREWTSSIFKEPVEGKVWLGETNLVGDEQADKKHHGGPEKAVFAYPTAHYEKWQEELEREDLVVGTMGENFAIDHMDEDDCCIGDTYEVGEAIIQVSQPRQPCWKPARRTRMIDFSVRIQNSGRTGWYFRVLQEGYVEAGDALTLIERPYPEWTITKANEVMHTHKQDIEAATKLASCEYLAINWKTTLTKRVNKEKESDIIRRIYGPNK